MLEYWAEQIAELAEQDPQGLFLTLLAVWICILTALVSVYVIL